MTPEQIRAAACAAFDVQCLDAVFRAGMEAGRAEALAEHQQSIGIVVTSYPRCTKKLREQGKPYPRTCQECGLGPCKVNP